MILKIEFQQFFSEIQVFILILIPIRKSLESNQVLVRVVVYDMSNSTYTKYVC